MAEEKRVGTSVVGGRLYFSSANFAHFFRQMLMMQKRRKSSTFLTVRQAIGPSFEVHFARADFRSLVWNNA
jgi:hypothetical protein